MKTVTNAPVWDLTLEQFAANNIKKVVFKSVYNEKTDSSNRTYIDYYTSQNTRVQISLRNINSRKEAIEFAYNEECKRKNFRLYDKKSMSYFYDHAKNNECILWFNTKEKASEYKDEYLSKGNYPDQPHTVIAIHGFIGKEYQGYTH